ncbi:UDP-4-amino-4,6-dideoxy-N-acetyl-beta-L-altrosamine transaminase [Bradyrhizobium sp. CCBAU 53338]|uniref:UDP-4-amino-4, 6-dideoxy-N-acetyl-beta-L-altrosamine transaminase n=1 Tax=Bradyrhizobium sp. CCBAU 53338 TaxID=1325111 RepID=UPI00188CBFC1|nr:UDP-4-amino-4,6-dideoxy-N-acetyl-beta-L-altrosamine transaminase [Bradyrhizobium sp. CCBAU 53338]QOZ51999.1 UDP-4-amino-4,6-dideoxy-N-acetyl-beta-L-altrosamine transaminase [Bradyrhizobium sp. CCBAU 53338]
MARAPIPYGRQNIDDEDLASVAEALRSAWLTTGPRVGEFERAFAEFCGAGQGVAVNSGTAALHTAMRALKIGPGDEVIVPAITFAASANAAIYEGGKPVFADVEPDTLLIDPTSVEQKITPRTRAIVAVDYGGQPADYDALRALAAKRGIGLVADACHAPGATYKGRKVGTIADLSAFSFHPVKHLTTCEGGMVLTNDLEMAAHMRRFRNHGIDSDHRSREKAGTFAYDMVELGYNYRLPDVQCALGIAQLKRLPQWISDRQAIAARYDKMFADLPFVRPLATRPDRTNAYHLYVIRLDLGQLQVDRRRAFDHLKDAGIAANVHYAPIYHHSFYRERFGYQPGLCPQAEATYREILTLPMFPGLSEADQGYVVSKVRELKNLC